jgi:hypothetical protein
MKLLRNVGADRVIDEIRPWLADGNQIDVVSPALSLFAFAETVRDISKLSRGRLLLPADGADLALLGEAADRGARNRLQAHWFAKQCANWLQEKIELRRAHGSVPQGAIVIRGQDGQPQIAVLGAFSLSTIARTR